MDDYTARVLAKWPDVPDVYGWLALDRRGQWRLKDEIIRHAGLNAFLSRTYGCTDGGRWFCQNGPQRVFVRLDYAPWVLRLSVANQLETHTGQAVRELRAAWLDDQGAMLIESEHGMAVIDDRDLPALLDAIVGSEQRVASEAELLALMNDAKTTLTLCWQNHELALGSVKQAELAMRFGFAADPVAPD